ncbi:hypothetical protein LMTR3_20840 [Bradyrhizobium sp. LMTR 3]|nr:hypothetical protein LMTR3_20840 [Bradyrhizobium sp. LMTR 3]
MLFERRGFIIRQSLKLTLRELNWIEREVLWIDIKQWRPGRFIIEHLPKFSWRELHCIEGEVLWIDQRQRPGLRTPLWLKLLMKPLFRSPKLPWIDRDRQLRGLVIQQSPTFWWKAAHKLLIWKIFQL